MNPQAVEKDHGTHPERRCQISCNDIAGVVDTEIDSGESDGGDQDSDGDPDQNPQPERSSAVTYESGQHSVKAE